MKSDVTSYKGRKAGAFSSGPVQKHHKILIDEKVTTSTIILFLSSSLPSTLGFSEMIEVFQVLCHSVHRRVWCILLIGQHIWHAGCLIA